MKLDAAAPPPFEPGRTVVVVFLLLVLAWALWGCIAPPEPCEEYRQALRACVVGASQIDASRDLQLERSQACRARVQDEFRSRCGQ